MQVSEGVLNVDHVDVGDEHAGARTEELAHELELLRGDLVRALGGVLPQPVGHAKAVEEARKRRVERDNQHVAHARGGRALEKELELRLHVGIAHRHHHLAVDRHPPQHVAHLLRLRVAVGRKRLFGRD